MHTILELQHITFGYKTGQSILNGLNLSLTAQSRLGIWGENGSGKSTLFHLCTGLLPMNSGKIVLEGRSLETEKDFCWARPRMGYLLQKAEDQLFCPTVLEDVAFGPMNLGASQDIARDTAISTLEHLGIAHLAEQSGCNISGGEQRMAALACVLAMHPSLLLLDEPTNDLDSKNIERLEHILDELTIPFIIISHDLPFLQKTTRSLAKMEHGQLATA